MTESVRYWRDPSCGGIDLLRATFMRHAFGAHAHDEFVLSAFEHGAERFVADGGTHVARRGTVLFIPPHTEHDGAAESAEGWSYRAFYPKPDLVGAVLRARAIPETRILGVKVYTSDSPALFDAVLDTHRFFERGGSLGEKENRLTAMLAHLLDAVTRRGEALEIAAGIAAGTSPLAERARHLIEARYASCVNAEEVATALGVSSAHLMRVFRAGTGQHLHVFLTQVRLRHARRLLLAGNDPADVACATGFVDQSHLIRRFRRAYGQTPGRYLRDTESMHPRATDDDAD